MGYVEIGETILGATRGEAVESELRAATRSASLVQRIQTETVGRKTYSVLHTPHGYAIGVVSHDEQQETRVSIYWESRDGVRSHVVASSNVSAREVAKLAVRLCDPATAAHEVLTTGSQENLTSFQRHLHVGEAA